MLQRIQSVYLFLSATIVSLALFIKIWSAATNESVVLDAFSANVTSGGTLTTKNVGYIGGVLVLSVVLNFYTIFQYNHRKRQVLWTNLNNVLLCLVMGLYYWEISVLKQALTGAYSDNWGFGFFVPLIGLLLNILAIRAIKKDEALIQSVDRIR
ncbi:MAG: DUF4293 domain-containing protein [Cytophagaceae bacterium]|jgi:hypothetical protein|nr:DUF4293 domain-containing protein [Cytophagaceae bacterium]